MSATRRTVIVEHHCDTTTGAHLSFIIEAGGLRKAFGTTQALEEVDLAARAGAVLGVLGPHGAGQTTAARMLATLLRADAGTARIDGFDVVKNVGQVAPHHRPEDPCPTPPGDQRLVARWWGRWAAPPATPRRPIRPSTPAPERRRPAGDQSPQPGPGDGDRTAVGAHLKRAEDPDLHLIAVPESTGRTGTWQQRAPRDHLVRSGR